MPSIITSIQDNLDPTSVSNALYETMLDWRTMHVDLVERRRNGVRNQSTRTLETRRVVMEKVIGRFINTPAEDVRRMLCDHYGLDNL